MLQTQFNKPIILLALLALLTPLTVHAQNSRAFGANGSFQITDLPPGIFRAQLETLPPAAQQRAISWLHNITFSEQDVTSLRVDASGGVFYEDPVFAESRFENSIFESTQGESAASEPSLEQISQTDAFTLHSKPGAARTVYLDMDGHQVSGTAWNSGNTSILYMRPYDTDGNEDNFSASELNDIAETWKRVAEDFTPYDIDVTTEEPASFDSNTGHILVTRKADEYGNLIYNCNCGGVAYVNVWGRSNYDYYQPALVFLDGVGGPHNISEAASHELGHNLSLSHDGTNSVGYYTGHGSGNIDWGPIMGVGYYGQVTQWSKGEYDGANNTQDDLEIIRGHLNYRTDDHEDVDYNQATPLTLSNGVELLASNPVTDPGNLNPANKGIIEDRSDIDLFYMDVGAGAVDISVTPVWTAVYTSQSRRGTNLDIQASLYDELGNLIITSDINNDTYAQLNTAVAGGRYILAINGVGVGDPLSNGYSDYGSLGQYFITGTVPEDQFYSSAPTAPSDLTALANGDNSIQLNWSDPASIADTNEAGYRLYRQIDGGSFILIGTLPRDSSDYADNNLASGDYIYYVEPYNSIGSNTSNHSQPLTITTPTVAHAGSESLVMGAIQSGSYLSTTTLAGSERLAEQHQGGKPQRRISQLEHIWTVSGIAAAASVSLTVDAQADANSEGDDFEFAYSINGSSYQTFDTLLNGSGRALMSQALPADTNGSVNIRVRDTDRSLGQGKIDGLDIFYIAITSSGEAGDQMPSVTISSPADNSQYDLGQAINFSASANDNEDDDSLLTDSISWVSDIDGTLGGGANIQVNNLSLGTHAISAQVTDSAGNIGSDLCTVIVSDPNIAPLAVNSMTPNPVSRAALRATETMTISGSGFQSGATVSFANGSGPAPTTSNIQVTSSTTISLDVSLGNGGPNKWRYWDVIITNSDGGSASCTDCLAIEP